MAKVTLQHALVNAGADIILESASVGYSFKNLNDSTPTPGRFDIVETQYGGFENPKITISGHIDIDDVLPNGLTQELLTSIAILKTEVPIVLTIETGSTATPLKGRPATGYSTSGSNAMISTINFIIDSFDIKLSNSADRAHLWTFSINGHETR